MAKQKPAPRDAALPTSGETLPPSGEMLRQNAPAPECPYHKVPCESNRSEPFFTRYYCPEPGCSYSQKVPRQRLAELARRRDEEEGFSAR